MGDIISFNSEKQKQFNKMPGLFEIQSNSFGEWDSTTWYAKGYVVWTDELAFILTEDYSVGEQPDISDNWKVYIKRFTRYEAI